MSERPWPPNYVDLFAWRQQQLLAMRADDDLLKGALAYYEHHPVEFICDWVDTHDPRNAGMEGKLTRMPFVLFDRQRQMVEFIMAVLRGEEDGLVEKCRDAGATWVCVAVSVWLWRFWPGVSVGWGSRKEQLVDKLGVMDSIFEKIRALIRGLPPEFLPQGFSERDHMTFMRIVNPETGSTIVGEAGDNIGRGGRTRIYFKDESAHYEHPEAIEAALGDNTRVQIDISSVCGIGNVFHRRREAGVDWDGGDVVKGKTNVFVFDWSDHPDKTQEWYNARRQKALDQGLLHVFAQEIDRDYSASVEGIIINAAWVKSAIDAHVKLGFSDDGRWCAGLDVADGGGDTNALSQRRGVVLHHLDEWGQVDTGVTARRAIAKLVAPRETLFSYDSVGVGAGVKSETNRLRRLKQLPSGLIIEKWNAGGAVQFPDQHMIKGDKDSPLNNDYFMNLAAQAWWNVSQRFWKTHQAVVEGIDHDPADLISISSSLPLLHKLTKELSQATMSLSTGRLKMQVDKAPEGTKSPNLAESVVMAYYPVVRTRYTLENVG